MESWKAYVGQVVVVDTDSQFVYLGTLKEAGERFVVLADADAHDARQSASTKEQYVMDTKRFGVKPNRREVAVRTELVVSLSRLEDVVLY
ncbi:MAG: hypothetical protein HYY17_06815 [Planctomycetes bacterium]|nr:hypothetical protein [Planctomycetota bacterium]